MEYDLVVSPLRTVLSTDSVALGILLPLSGKKLDCKSWEIHVTHEVIRHESRRTSLCLFVTSSQHLNPLGNLRNMCHLMGNGPLKATWPTSEIRPRVSPSQAPWGPCHRWSMCITLPSVMAFNKLSELANAAFRWMLQFPLLSVADVS